MARSLVLSLALGALLLASSARAERTPDQGPEDPRIRTVVYNPRDVVRVVGHYGYHTLIELAEGETVESILIGDSVAWQVIPTKRGNTIAVKPTEANASTNLTVITDRRTYAFMLEARGGKVADAMTWRLQFRYPTDEAAAQAALLEQQRVRQAALVNPDSPTARAALNFRYEFAGSKKLVPEVLFDDGEFTYLRFPEGRPLPAIFRVEDDKSESLLTHTIAGGYVRIPLIARQLSLRAGTDLTCIFNTQMQRVQTQPIVTPTARPDSAPAGE